MRLLFDAVKVVREAGEVWLSLRLGRESRQEGLKFAFTFKGKPHIAEIAQFRNRRSDAANRKCWAMLRELSDALGIPDVELYRRAVRDVGPYKVFHVTPDEAKTLCAAWGALGIGWVTEKEDYTPDGERLIIRAYYGSSTYDTKQMSRLLDYIIQDCKAVGIETMSERERSLLLEDWKGDGKHFAD